MKITRYLTISLLSVTLIASELIWTRIFSAEYFYTFAFLVLSLAILGLGMGALTLRLFPVLTRKTFLGVFLSFAGLMVLIGPPLAFKLNLDFSILFISEWAVVKLLAVIGLLSSTFYFGGMALASIFRSDPANMPRLYMADMLGAGIGVIFAVAMMNVFGTPSAVVFSAIPVLTAAAVVSYKWFKIVPAVLAGLLVLLNTQAPDLLRKDREERAPVIYEHWDAMAKLKIYDFAEDYRGLNIDNAANTPVYGFDGDWDKPDSLLPQFGIDAGWLISQFDSCTFLSLGAGGGADVLQALRYGASEVYAAEVVGRINELMSEGELAEFSGNIYHDPRVQVVTEDARAYARRFDNKFDMIYSLSSNTFAALASGAFALAENYLFTTEAFEDYWTALTDSGFMMMEHQFYVPRLTSELITALQNLGVEDYRDHFAIYDLPSMHRKMILLSKRQLTDEIRYNAFFELNEENFSYIHLLYPPADSLQDNYINRIVNEGWQAVQAETAVDISPCDDDRPFAAQLGLWKNFNREDLQNLSPFEFRGFPLSKMIIAAILAVTFFLILPLSFLPCLFNGKKLKPVPFLYFFLIGLGYMTVEVILIQKYSLLIGPSSAALITILTTLLMASGIGSRFAEKIRDQYAFAGIFVLLLLDVFVFKYLIYAFGGLEMPGRIAATAVMIFPLGFFMGLPFPKAGARVGELVDWGFAVNGVASVIGSAGIILIAITYGFTVSLLIGLVIYLGAFGLIRMKKGWVAE